MQYRHKLKEYRLNAKKSQKDIAILLNISQQQYSLYESEKREMPIGQYALLAKYYNVKIDDLIEIIEEPTEDTPTED